MDPSVRDYLDGLPEERRPIIEAVREVVLANLPDGLEEIVDFGMLAYVVPLDRYPKTYNGHPLMHTALGNQKRHASLYLMGIYADPVLRERFDSDYRATGKRYDVGASCVRFRKLDDLPLEVIGEAIAAVSVDDLCRAHDGVKSLRAARKSHKP